MANYNLSLNNLLTTATAPREKYSYVNGERTETINGYMYRLIDIANGEVLSVTIPYKKTFTPQSYVEVVNATGTPYIANNRATLSIKADNILMKDEL